MREYRPGLLERFTKSGSGSCLSLVLLGEGDGAGNSSGESRKIERRCVNYAWTLTLSKLG
jgi:hypothetical protein